MEEALLEGNEDEEIVYPESAPLDPKSIDIFQHMKINLKNMELNCRDNNRIASYCIPCKMSICSKCRLDEHKSHILIQKKQFDLENEAIQQIFAPLEEALNDNLLFTNSEECRQQLIQNVDSMIEQLEVEIQKMRAIKLQEIDLMFENFNRNLANLRLRIDETKSMILAYLERNKTLFNLKPINEIENLKQKFNKDHANTLFFLHYDMLSLCHQRSKDVKTLIKGLTADMENYRELQAKKLQEVIDIVEKSFEDLINDNDQVDNNRPFLGKYIPNYSFIITCEKLNNDHFKEIPNRLSKYNGNFDAFRKSVFDTVTKTGSLKDIEKYISVFENVKQTGLDSLFSKRRSSSIKNKRMLEEGVFARVSYSNKDDVIINHHLLEKYFGYLTLDMYGKNFKMLTKELQSSHADLMIKIDPDEEETDFAKPIEGTNEVIMYYRKNSQMIKKALKLKKNPFGYTRFPFGCRSILVGDKLYITGGKDETQQYGNVIIYDRKTDHLKRIMDMRYPRCYHTLIYNEIFESLMVFGGENCNSVEIFDPLTNRWQLLPSLNIPRANPIFYFDKPRGYLYTLFGMEGKIISNNYSDAIEYMDLTDIKKGWMRLEYNNKAEADLRTLLGVYPLSSDKLLISGGTNARKTSRVLCIFNILKNEILTVDKKLLDDLRAEAKKSRKLSSLVLNIGVN